MIYSMIDEDNTINKKPVLASVAMSYIFDP